ncbi:transcription antitermination factor NusB [Porphyromonas crevioricanis]|uniref:transcription antitermination factor NusB n=1 Tax=Porphyromonas crevioricanis TaxID=393921 RepID=UPI0009DCB831|nr:transcription antitermination factor NusB [Porphyromonas crevioricanis]
MWLRHDVIQHRRKMINRTIIRTRALQIAYAYQHREMAPIRAIVEALELSLKETYEFYLHFLGLLSDLTDLHCELLEARKHKHLATKEDKNPDMRLANNSLAVRMRQSPILQEYASSAVVNWRSNDSLLRRLLNKLLASDAYRNYLSAEPSIEADTTFWAEVYRDLIFCDEDVAEELEAYSPFWDNPLQITEKYGCEEMPDIETIDEAVEELKAQGNYRYVRADTVPVEIAKDFVLKTIRKMKDNEGPDSGISPMYKDPSDRQFAIDLISLTIENGQDYWQKLQSYLINWDGERVADIDMLIMQMAMVEISEMDEIPAHISINEYIELAKSYSTPKSYAFINGVLDKLAQQMAKKKSR